MKMRFFPIIVLLCLHYQCKGVSSGEGSTKSHSRGSRFSTEEDKLIIEEVSRLTEDNQLKIFSNPLWEHVSDKIRQKFEQRAQGFSQVRSPGSLQGHFRLMAKTNHQRLESKLPESLLKLIRQDLNESAQEYNPAYTPEEDEFILEELSKPAYTSLFASSTLEAVRQEHARRFQAQTPGFENERTAKSLRCRLEKLKRVGKLQPELIQKIRKYHFTQGASSSAVSGAGSSESTSDQQTTLEVINYENDDE